MTEESLERRRLPVPGWLRVDFVGGRPSDVHQISRTIDLVRDAAGDGQDAADITIRFVERIPAVGPVRRLTDSSEWTRSGFIVRNSYGGRAQLPVEDLGRRPCEILCEGRLREVPLLASIVHLLLLAKGIAPLHVTAFQQGDRQFLAGGWSGGGKTAALLAFLERGAQHVASEWLFVHTREGQAYAAQNPIRVRREHIVASDRFRRSIPVATRLRLAATGQVARGMRNGARGRVPVVARLADRLARRAYVDAWAHEFGTATAMPRARSDAVCLMVATLGSRVRVRRVDSMSLATALASAGLYEHLNLASIYTQFRYAFPRRRNELFEDAPDRLTSVLHEAIADADLFVVEHPRTSSLKELGDAMASAFELRHT